MKPSFTPWKLLFAGIIAIIGCSQAPRPGEEPVYVVSGKVTVDDQVVPMLQVTLYREGDESRVPISQGFTKDDGSIELSTYASGDGAPAGKYRVTFVWKDYDVLSRSFNGPDRFSGIYRDPDTSSLELIVGEGYENSLGDVELTSR